MKIGDYIIKFQSRLGTVSKGEILDCRYGDIERVVKIIETNDEKQWKRTQREIQIANIIQNNPHQNLIKIHDILQSGEKIYIFMEKGQMNFQEYIGQKNNCFTDDEYKDFLYQINSGYKKLIELQIFHRDLKAENIVVTFDQQGHPIYKLIDFDSGKVNNIFQQSSRFQTPAQGTSATQAPEAISKVYDNRADLYSLGIIVLQMCNFLILELSQGKKTIDQISQKTTLKQVFIKPENLPQFIWDILDKIIIKQENRITWKEFDSMIQQSNQFQKQYEPTIQNNSRTDQINTPPKITIQHNFNITAQQQQQNFNFFTPTKNTFPTNNLNFQKNQFSAPLPQQKQTSNPQNNQDNPNTQRVFTNQSQDCHNQHFKFKSDYSQQNLIQGAFQNQKIFIPEKKNIIYSPSCNYLQNNLTTGNRNQEIQNEFARTTSHYVQSSNSNNNNNQKQPTYNQFQVPKQTSLQNQGIFTKAQNFQGQNNNEKI